MRIACGVLMVLLVGTPAIAGDDDEIHVTVMLRTGAKIRGIVRGGLERLERGSFRDVEKADHPDTGYRVWHTTGTNGFFFVRHRDIVEVQDDGPVSDEQRKKLDAALKSLKQAAQQARKKAREELGQLEERQKAQAETEVRETDESKVVEGRREEEAVATKLAALLEKFPPTEWKPERKEQIRSNQVVLGLAPSPREKEWLESYDLWKQAYDQWKKKQDEEKDAAGAGDARSTRPSAPSEGTGGESS